MVRRLGPTLAVIAALTLAPAGCRSVGRFPTIDPADYAYSYFNGIYTQVFQFNPAQVESSTLQALADLGFTKIERKRLADGKVEIKCWTLDHRPACVWVKPRNEAMTLLSIYVGIVGDEMVSQTFMERVALNFGTVPRIIIPMEPTIERRFNPMPPLQPTLPKVVSIPATLPPDAVPLAEPSGGDFGPAPAIIPVPPAPAADPGPFGTSESPITPPPPAPGLPAPSPTPGP